MVPLLEVYCQCFYITCQTTYFKNSTARTCCVHFLGRFPHPTSNRRMYFRYLSTASSTPVHSATPKKMQLAPGAMEIHPAGTESRSQIWYIAPISTIPCILPDTETVYLHALYHTKSRVQAGTTALEVQPYLGDF